MMFDRVYIQDLLVRCIIGMNDNECRAKQDVVINIILYHVRLKTSNSLF